MSEDLIDYSFLEELSGGAPQYNYDILGIFLDTMNEGLHNLANHITSDDFEAIEKQAHALKSPSGIVKVKGMHEIFQKIEHLGRERTGKEEIMQLFAEVQSTYQAAKPILEEERAKNEKLLDKEE